MKRGIILIWSGSIVSIPTGFILCDGAGGSPDLRDRFVLGAGGTQNPGDTGGAVNHTHNFTANAHNHALPVGANIGGGATYSNISSATAVTGTTDSDGTLPPYYALAFIFKT